MEDIALRTIEQYNKLNELLMSESDHNKIINISKDKSAIEDLYEGCVLYIETLKAIKDTEELINSGDEELAAMAKDELHSLKQKIASLEESMKLLLIPQDPFDKKNAILEIRAGTGGDEASLFAADLVKMYQRYAELQNWKFDIIELSPGTVGGIKEATIEIKGKNVFGKMRLESGTHRVQRVPETENSGRVHTSAATVAVFPEVEDIDIQINPSDLKIDVYRASGAGGQHVNKTESAVRITHLPSGIVAACQTDRSQIKNREAAMKILRGRLYEHEEQKRIQSMTNDRKAQIGSGDRSEKIRTYNFPQNRLTDHRIGYTSHSLDQIMQGNISDLMEALETNYKEQVLQGKV